ncbi:tyrosine-type recombinase/integrase [Mesorhizobium sp. M0146]|uniref:tyrosine-type recombinase/integrase n=1 Tax=unclassified Mesorhizobium TaxID=325217 RepID=UPI0033390BA9
MSKRHPESPITGRVERKTLAEGVHWRFIDATMHLGYRKKNQAGVWLVRWRRGKGYQQCVVGHADDVPGKGKLDYHAADKAARKVVDAARAKEKASEAGPVLTVADIVVKYVSGRDDKHSKRFGREIRSDAGQRLRRYVLGQDRRGKQEAVPAAAISKVAFHDMSEDDLIGWRNELPHSLKGTSVRRLTNDLKAALNRGYALNRKRLPLSLPAVIKNGLSAAVTGDDEAEPVARQNQILGDADIGRLILAAKEIDAEQEWSGDLFRLILLLASTGARFSQVIRIRVKDCQIAAKRVLIPVSRKGRGGHTGSTAVPLGADVVETLLPATVGRDPDAILLERWRSRQVAGDIRWERFERGPWTASADFARPWRAIVERAGLAGTIPYALRHSSIVRGIRMNLPIRLVAGLHNTSVSMIEKHYSAWISDGLEDLARQAIVPLLPQEPGSNVIRISTRD